MFLCEDVPALFDFIISRHDSRKREGKGYKSNNLLNAIHHPVEVLKCKRSKCYRIIEVSKRRSVEVSKCRRRVETREEDVVPALAEEGPFLYSQVLGLFYYSIPSFPRCANSFAFKLL